MTIAVPGGDPCLSGRSLFEAVDDGDVWVLDRGKDLRFALEACEPFRIVRECGRQNLDRDVAIEIRVVCPIDLAHAARTQ